MGKEKTPKKKRKLRLKKEVKGILAFILVLAAICVVIGMIRMRKRFVFEERLSDIVLQVEDTNISLKEISYYIMLLEADVDKAARIYDAENPRAYWNLYMNQETQEGYESGYISDLAKQAVMDNCILDNIYYKEAVAAGFTLTPELLEDIRYEANKKCETMTKRQREKTQLNPEEMYLIMEKAYTARQYMASLAAAADEKMLQKLLIEYDIGGDLYENIKQKYHVAIDESLWDNVIMGTITVDY